MLFSRRQTSRRDRNFLRGFNNQRLQRHLMPEALESRCMLSASAGLLDPTFGLGGIVTQDLYPNTSANSFTFESGRAIDSYQLDGETKTVVAGQVTDLVIESYFPEGSDEEQFNFIDTHDVLVARYNEDGSFDASFGTGGVTRIDFGDAVDEANCLAVDSQGRIIIGGRSGDEMVVARLSPAGALDSTFGTAGIQVVEFDGASSAAAYDLAVDASDRVVLAGIEIRQGRQSLAAARILPDSGELDPSFGVDGTQSIDIGGHGTSNAESLTIDHLGRIVLAGTHRSGIGSPNPNDFAVTRLTANGLLDSTFGLDADGDRIRDGWTFIDFNATDDQAYGIGVDALNRVIVGGTTQENGIDFAVSRLTASGELDTSFGLDGKQTIAVEGHANLGDIVVDQFGRTVIAGSTLTTNSNDVAAARLTVDGTLDFTFGNDGTITFGEANQSDIASGVAIDPLGRILLTGGSDLPVTSTQLTIARLTGDNTPPADGNQLPAVAADGLYVVVNQGQTAINTGAFGDVDADSVTLSATAGTVVDNGDGTWSWSMDTAFQIVPDQSITITAADSQGATSSATFNLVINRTPRAGLLDTSFSDDGRLFVGIATFASRRTVGHQSDGKLIATFWSGQNTVVVRYNPDGSPDLTFGVNGQATIDFASTGSTFFDSAGALAIDALDRIVIAGSRGIEGEGWGFGVVRLSKDGELETSFGDGGLQSVILSGIGATAESVTIDSQQRIVVGGVNFTDSGVTDFAVARLNASGEVDFQRTVDFGTYDYAYNVAVDSQDRIVLAGATNQDGNTIHASASWDMAMVRLLESGDIDLQQTIDFGIGLPFGYGVAVDSQDRIILANSAEKPDGQNFRFVVRRLTVGGETDFQKTIEFGRTSVPFDVAVDSRDRIVLAGVTGDDDSASNDFAVTRLTSDGDFDLLFGTNGLQRIDFGGTPEDAYGVSIDPQDNVVIAGTSDRGNAAYEPVLARLTSGNDAVFVTVDQPTTIVDAGQIASNSGDFHSFDDAAVLLSASAGSVTDNGDGTWTWTLATSSPAEFVVAITATDLHGSQSTVTFQLTIETPPVAEPGELATAIAELPVGTTEVQVAATDTNLAQFVTAITELPANNSSEVIEIVINLDQGDYDDNGVIDVPAGYRVIINGSSGQVIFHGSSPALVVQSGDVLVTGVTFVNDTDASTILVTGGSLSVRNSTIRETTGGTRAAIEIAGGTLDLGTIADAGGNTLELNGAGDFIRNLSDVPTLVYGNEFLVNGITIPGNVVVDANTRLIFDSSSGTVIVAPLISIVEIDVRPSSLNIDQNGAISLVIFGSSRFDVTQVDVASLKLAGVAIDIFNESLSDANQDNSTDLVIHFHTSAALKAALTDLYADELLKDYVDSSSYSNKQQSMLALDGAFGEFSQEFQGTDLTNLFLAGKSLHNLLESLGI